MAPSPFGGRLRGLHSNSSLTVALVPSDPDPFPMAAPSHAGMLTCPICNTFQAKTELEIASHAERCRPRNKPETLDAAQLAAPATTRETTTHAKRKTSSAPAKPRDPLGDVSEQCCVFCLRPRGEGAFRQVHSQEYGVFSTHVLCALYNSGVPAETDDTGASIARGATVELKRAHTGPPHLCSAHKCRKKRALLGCAHPKCPREFHFPCARELAREGRAVFAKNVRACACFEHMEWLRSQMECEENFSGIWFEKEENEQGAAAEPTTTKDEAEADENAERLQREETERRAREEAEGARKKEEEVRRTREEEEQKREEARRRGETERRAREEALRREETERRAREEAEGARKKEEVRRIREEEKEREEARRATAIAAVIPPDSGLFPDPPIFLLGHALTHSQLAIARKTMRAMRNEPGDTPLWKTIRVLSKNTSVNTTVSTEHLQRSLLSLLGVDEECLLGNVLDDPEDVLVHQPSKREDVTRAIKRACHYMLLNEDVILRSRRKFMAGDVIAPVGGVVMTEAEYDTVRYPKSFSASSVADLLDHDVVLESASSICHYDGGTAVFVKPGRQDDLDLCIPIGRNARRDQTSFLDVEVFGVPLRFLIAATNIKEQDPIYPPRNIAKERVVELLATASGAAKRAKLN